VLPASAERSRQLCSPAFLPVSRSADFALRARDLASRTRRHRTPAYRPRAANLGQPIDYISISAPGNWRRSTDHRNSKFADLHRFVTHYSHGANYGFRTATLVLSRPTIRIALTLHACSLESFLVTPISCNVLVSVLLYYTRSVYCNVLVLLDYPRSVYCNVLVSDLLCYTRSVHCNVFVSVLFLSSIWYLELSHVRIG